MTTDDRLRLSAEKTALERMIARTPASQVIDRASLTARLRNVVAELEVLPASTRPPARVQLTFRGKPVVGSHGIFAEFGLAAVNGFTNAVAAMEQAGDERVALVSHGAALRVWAISQDPIGFHLAPPLKNTEWIVLNGSTRTGWKIERWGSTYQIDPE